MQERKKCRIAWGAKELTNGPVFQTITYFALPMLLGNLLQQLYNIVDTWIVGKYIGPKALAAVGAVFALMVFLTSILLGLCMGSGVVFSLDFGKKDYEALERRIGTAFAGIAVLTLILTLLSYLGMDGILRWLNIPAELYAMTRDYLKIIILGIPAVFIYNFFGAYLKSLGDSVTPLVFLAASAVINIVLDFILVVEWKQGVMGAACATIIAQYLSGAGCAVSVFLKEPCARRALRKFRILKEDAALLIRYSFFTCLQQSVMNLGILMVQGIVNSFGTAVMAAFAAGVKIDAFAYMPAQEYGNAFSTFLAQNRGAGEEKRVKEGIRCALAASAVYCGLASIVLWSFAENLMKIFVREEETEIIRIGAEYLHIEGAFYIGIGCLFLLYGLYRGLGKPEMSLVLTVISLGTRVLLAKLASVTSIGVTGIWWAIPIGWILADFTGMAFYLCKRRKGKLLLISLLLGICTFLVLPENALAKEVFGEPADEREELQLQYQDYQERLSEIRSREEISENGFTVITEQIFPMETAAFGNVTLVPAIETTYHRLVLFWINEAGTVVYRTDQLEMNNRSRGTLEQPIKRIAAISFQDLNSDGKMDIVLLAACENKRGTYAGKSYKIGEVLFQSETGFYRDYRISDKINRFSMNKSAECITAFVRDGYSTEFLYTATTKQELLASGFLVEEGQCYYRQFEKLGWLEVVPGTYTMANFSTFMIYLVNEQGYIVWSFQLMGEYDNLYAFKGITCRDIDGDGMKDILVLARYSNEGSGTELVTMNDYSVYYQRTTGFYEDKEIKAAIPCSEEDTVAGLVEKTRAYWGWSTANDKNIDSR